jgi:hypothetical protein
MVETILFDNVPLLNAASASSVASVLTWTGDGMSNRVIVGVGFSPDIALVKRLTNSSGNWILVNSVMGTSWYLQPDVVDPRQQGGSSRILSLDSNGITIGNNAEVNASGESYVGYFFQRGPGLDIVEYVGTGQPHTEAHNLGVTPDMMWIKNQEGSFPPDGDWPVYHAGTALGTFGTAPEWQCELNETHGRETNSTPFDDTMPTSSEFSVGGSQRTNQGGSDIIAFLYGAVEGRAAFGSYEGVGSAGDGHTQAIENVGFQPDIVMIKRLDSYASWLVFDSERGPTNIIALDSSATETTNTDTLVSFDSNGFTVGDDHDTSRSAGTYYIWAAWKKR